MLGTLLFIVVYGAWKNRKSQDLQGYLLGNKDMKWHTIGLSVMATQASAITFLSVPGKAYVDGMGFAQFYFGLPLAMIVISIVFVPIYYRLKVYTAYEFLESRFDLKTRSLAAILFLIQRGLAAGITIYAPSIILSQILGWNLSVTVIFIGILVTVYTVSGGTKAVSQTHKQQMAVIFAGMFIAFGVLVYYLSDHLTFGETMKVAGKMDKLEVINWDFDFENRYNIWSGIIAGFFLQLSYFGTDQSQVQRYLSGQSVKQSRLGLMFNALLKVPMQFFILLIGVLMFAFYQYVQPPVYFNQVAVDKVHNSEYDTEFKQMEQEHAANFEERKTSLEQLVVAMRENDVEQEAALTSKLQHMTTRDSLLQVEVRNIVWLADPDNKDVPAEKQEQEKKKEKDGDYIFISFVMGYLPIGIVGLLLAVIFSAAMSSTSAELNALASTASIDMYKRIFKKDGNDKHYLIASRLLTVMFGALAIAFALVASLFDNLIEAVNILGSLFYGTILGIFLVAFFLKKVSGNVVFISAILAEIIVIWAFNKTDIGYLWLNPIGCLAVMLFSVLLRTVMPRKEAQ